MMLKAKHNFIVYTGFKIYTFCAVKNHFSKVFIKGTMPDLNLPIVVIANHISWWDGIWTMHLNMKVFKRKFHFMMLENQLRQHMFFIHLGGYSITKKSKSIIESIQYTSQLLANPRNLVLLFPEGKIHSMHNQQFVYQTGIKRILEKIDQKNIQIVFLANFIDYFSGKKPSLYMYYEQYIYESFSIDDMQNCYNQFYKKSAETQKKLES